MLGGDIFEQKLCIYPNRTGIRTRRWRAKIKPRIFLKMYVDAVHDGLVSSLGPELW